MGPVYLFFGGGRDEPSKKHVACYFEGFYVNCSALFGVMVL